MEESALFSLASSLQSKMASLVFIRALHRVIYTQETRDDLDRLTQTISTIKAVILDAEERQHTNPPIRIWMKRVTKALYELDDLFDEVSTNDLQMKDNTVLRELQVIFSGSCQMVFKFFNHPVAKKIMAVMRSLDQISKDITQFSFVPNLRKTLVDQDLVIGRDYEKAMIMSFLLHGSNEGENVSVLSITGIGGIGKSALAQVVYNHVQVQQNFANRWRVCVSRVFDEKDFLGMIFQSITWRCYQDFSLSQLIYIIRKSITMNGKFLLVVEDLWDEDHHIGRCLRSLLSSDGAKGSKIILTSRSSSVALAMEPREIRLQGLPKDASWELFKKLAFAQEQAEDENLVRIGMGIVNKCRDVPLVIKSIASVLRTKTTVQEWNSFADEGLDDSDLYALKLSYDYLLSNLKNCFAYCSLFPENYIICKEKLIYLWIAQGYIKPRRNETFEEAGHACFMELTRRFFLTQVERDDNDEIVSCKIDGLANVLARRVAGEESVMLTESLDHFPNDARHVSVRYEKNNTQSLLPPLLETARLHSLLFVLGRSYNSLSLDKLATKFRFLRTLDLQALNLDKVPSSVGMLKHLRFLGLSKNLFKHLPDSITKLLNLLTLDISDCLLLEALPDGFRKLIRLRHLDISGCTKLLSMPPRFGDMESLQHLSDFKVSETSRLSALAGLDLRRKLRISFDNKTVWCRNEPVLECGQIPSSLEMLRIFQYPSIKIPVWWKEEASISHLPKLVHLDLESCPEVKHLPPLRHLPCLKTLKVNNLEKLRYMEDDEFVATTMFFPSLQRLELVCLPKLERWSVNVEEEKQLSFPLVSRLVIRECPRLEPVMPSLKSVHVRRNEPRELSISKCSSFELWEIGVDF